VTDLSAETTSQILISYSREDREPVIKLYNSLETMGFNLWRDLHSIPLGDDFWDAIQEGIDNCETVILCLSDDSCKSEWVQKEWQYARQEGKRVIPIVINTDVTFKNLPRWMRDASWADFREGQPERDTVWARFIRDLNTPYEGRKVPFMVDKLPDFFVQRPTEFDNLVGALVDGDGAVAITAAVKGAGGFGKTTLALALCHDTDVRGAFDDGVLWATLGERPTQSDLIRYALNLIYAITGDRPPLDTKEAVKAELTRAIGERYMLLVLDDLWRKTDADIFLTDNPNSAVLITTRFDHTLTDIDSDKLFKQNVDAMSDDEAVKLLTWGIEAQVTDDHHDALNALAKRLGKWAVIVRLVNATLRKRIESGDSLDRALRYADKALTKKGLIAFDEGDDAGRANAVKATLEVSLDLLKDDEQAHFARLAIFPDDADIPFTTLEKLWDLDDFDTEDIADALNDASLLQNYDLGTRTIRLHDVIRQYLIDQHADHLTAWQGEFVDNLDIPIPYGRNSDPPLQDDYIWRNLAYHLIHAGRHDTLRALLLDFDFLQAKLNHTDPNALIGDCEMYLNNIENIAVEANTNIVGVNKDTVGTRHALSLQGDAENVVRLIQSALSLSAHIIGNDAEQLSSQLVGRLVGHKGRYPAIDTLMGTIHDLPKPDLLFLHPTLPQAGGALQRTLVGHESGVNDVAISGEFAVSVSDDNTVRVWNWKTGAHRCTLEGHTGSVTSVALAGEFAVTASNDKTVRVWNWQTGAHIRTLEGHTRSVNSVALAGEFAVTASEDGRLRVWNWQTGDFLRTFGWHSNAANSVSLAGEFAVSASDGGMLQVWNWQTGDYLRALDGHKGSVYSVALVGEFAVSASWDKTVRVWNWQTGDQLQTLDGHTNWVTSVALAGDYVVSASLDQTLRVWNWQTGDQLRTLDGHTGAVRSVALASDVAVSASRDQTLRVWKLPSSAKEGWQDEGLEEHNRTSSGHTSSVYSVALAGEYTVSASLDQTMRVWNWHTGEHRRTFGEHMGQVYSVALAGEVAVNASSDEILQVWNWQTGAHIRTLEGHTASVISVALAGEVAVSASHDKTLRVWNWQTGAHIRTLEGHTNWVNSLALSGEFAVSASDDKTVQVWNWQTGAHIRTLEGHTDPVYSVALAGDVAVSVSLDKTVRVWNWKKGELLETLPDQVQSHLNIAQKYNGLSLSGGNNQHPTLNFVLSGNHVLMHPKTSATVLARVTVGGEIRSLGANEHGLVLGDAGGKVHFLRIKTASG